MVLRTVFSTGSIALLEVAKLVLTNAGIPFLTKGEGLAERVGGVRFRSAPSLVTGPMEIQVLEADLPEATALLQDVRETGATL